MSPFFPVPVRTQEPVQVSEERAPVALRVRRFTHNAGSTDFQDTLTVSPGYKWRIISITGTLYPGAVNNQRSRVVIRSDTPDNTSGNVVYDCWSMHCGAALHRVLGLWVHGASRAPVTMGTYQQYTEALPELWLPPNYRIDIFGTNVHALDVYQYYVAYEEERL